jgi:hypothetical protein
MKYLVPLRQQLPFSLLKLQAATFSTGNSTMICGELQMEID